MSLVKVGDFDALPTDTGTLVEVGRQRVAVFRVGPDVFALADRCSHAEASLAEGVVFDTEVECPRHGATFDLTDGSALTLPATRPVATYKAFVEDGEVFVEMEETN